mmetsp:Transcript_4787/g.15984  ORF Transcript_4787/g.15984 Transcript_4787/m.15984 type:complete len:238 (+) Transcript_4787:759-1472(+)
MSPNASRLLAASAAAKKSSNVLLPAVFSRYVPTAFSTNVEHTCSNTDLPSSLAARCRAFSRKCSSPDGAVCGVCCTLPSSSIVSEPAASACAFRFDSRHTSMSSSRVCRVVVPTTTETTPQFRGSNSLSSKRSAALGPLLFDSPPSPDPPITAEAAPAIPRATPLETLCAHSSSSGVFTRRTTWRMESGMGASASALMNKFASIVSLEMSSEAASAAEVYPSVAAASCLPRSEFETR